MAATGWIAIPVGPVPVTLQIFGVVLAALLLSWEWAAVALGIYLVLGRGWMPVFSLGTAGLGVVLGPTGGYVDRLRARGACWCLDPADARASWDASSSSLTRARRQR